MIIVLGEAVSQVVRATSGRDWNGGLARAAFCAFLLLVGLWWLTFQYGFATSPESRLARMPARFGLPLHFLTTASIIFLATGLGETVSDPLSRLDAGPRWLAAGGLAGYLAVNALAASAIGASADWLLGWALPTVVLAIGVGALGWALAGWGVALLLLAAVGWQVGYGFLRERGQTPRMAAALSGSGPGAGTEHG
jgi:low temperature requirement protein LtrA